MRKERERERGEKDVVAAAGGVSFHLVAMMANFC